MLQSARYAVCRGGSSKGTAGGRGDRVVVGVVLVQHDTMYTLCCDGGSGTGGGGRGHE